MPIPQPLPLQYDDYYYYSCCYYYYYCNYYNHYYHDGCDRCSNTNDEAARLHTKLK